MGIVTYEILCEHCGTEFTAKSTKRKYCSGKCRTAAHRYHAIQASESSKGNKLEKLMNEVDELDKEFEIAMQNYRNDYLNKKLWARVEAVHRQSMRLTAEIANLVAN